MHITNTIQDIFRQLCLTITNTNHFTRKPTNDYECLEVRHFCILFNLQYYKQ